MTPPPPRTTLFPYTTLFRSSYSGDTNNAAIATACNDPGETSVVNQATPVLTTVATPTALVGGSISDTANLAGGFGTLGGTITFTLYGARKGTRLNSSHSTNTYAVVCLRGETGTATSNPFTPSQAAPYRCMASDSADTDISTLSLHDALPI